MNQNFLKLSDLIKAFEGKQLTDAELQQHRVFLDIYQACSHQLQLHLGYYLRQQTPVGVTLLMRHANEPGFDALIKQLQLPK